MKDYIFPAIVFSIAFLMLAIPVLAAENFDDVDSLTVDVDISGRAEIVKETAKARVDKVMVNLSLFPKDDFHQAVEHITFNPKAAVESDASIFIFQSPRETIEYSAVARVRVGDSFVEVKESIPFPIDSLPDEVKPYVLPTEIIDSGDEGINKIASQLVSGEDDLFGAVYSLAKWTRENVNYNLSSVTADVSQKASWVLLERKGVCDEITSLFIAMLRSLGIPAKFVTGYAYTTSPLFPENWGAHGWAEVYFPGYGWVPFDITYGQFGWVDATHIKLKESADPNDASTRYEWVGRDVELKIGELKTTVEVAGKKGKAAPFVEISVRPLKGEIGFGSYNAIEAEVINLRDSFVMAEMQLGAPPEAVIVGNRAKDIMLKPREKKNVYWIIRLDGELEDNFIYTFPLSVRSSRTVGEGFFKSTGGSPRYTLQEIGSIIDQLEEEEEKVYSSKVSLNCTPSRKSLYSYENGVIGCAIKNTGNTPLLGLDVCMAKECEAVDLGISREYEVEFAIDTKKIGKRDERIVARNEKVTRAQDVTIEVLDAPAIDIGMVNLPPSVEFEQEVTLLFEVGKVSYSIPRNLTILVKLPSGEKGWTIDGLLANQSFSMRFKGLDLKKGENEILIEAVYHDGNNREYSTTKKVPLTLENVTFWQGVRLWVRDVGIWVGGVFSND